jgi:3-dehydroquinate dehydratase I
MRRPPNLFELRLDCLLPTIAQLQDKIPRLRAPLIITARSPQEGGVNALSNRERRNLLSRFLSCARYVDIELHSAVALRPLLRLAEENKVKRILSYHNFKSTPPVRVLLTKARAAGAHGANIFKVATRTDTPVELTRLLEFVTSENVGLAVSAMGIGRLGAISRVLLARAGSALLYASITGGGAIEGQLSLEQLRDLGIQ